MMMILDLEPRLKERAIIEQLREKGREREREIRSNSFLTVDNTTSHVACEDGL